MLGCQPHGNFIVFYNGFIGCQCLLVCLSQISKAEVPPITQNKLSRKTSSQLFAGHLVLLYKWNLPLKVTSVSLPFASHTFQLCHFPCPGCEMSTFDAVKPGKKTGPWFLLSTMPGSPGQSTFHQLQLISFHFDLSSTLFILIAPWIPRYPVKSSLSTHCLFRQGSKTHLGTKPVSPVTGFLQKRQPLRPPQRGWSCGRRWHHCIQNRAKMQR